MDPKVDRSMKDMDSQLERFNYNKIMLVSYLVGALSPCRHL